MRFISGLVIGSLLGYYAGATHFSFDIKEKLAPDNDYCAYENTKKPTLEEYVSRKKEYVSKLEGLTYELNI